MEGNGEVQGKRKRLRSPRRRSKGHRTHAYPYELRRKAVRLCLEEGFPVDQVTRCRRACEREIHGNRAGCAARAMPAPRLGRTKGDAGVRLPRRGDQKSRPGTKTSPHLANALSPAVLVSCV